MLWLSSRMDRCAAGSASSRMAACRIDRAYIAQGEVAGGLCMFWGEIALANGWTGALKAAPAAGWQPENSTEDAACMRSSMSTSRAGLLQQRHRTQQTKPRHLQLYCCRAQLEASDVRREADTRQVCAMLSMLWLSSRMNRCALAAPAARWQPAGQPSQERSKRSQ
jgi:hypothetical protein